MERETGRERKREGGREGKGKEGKGKRREERFRMEVGRKGEKYRHYVPF